MNFRDIWTVTKKELRAGFSDKLILFQVILVPFLIVVGYTMLMGVMGNAASGEPEDNLPAYYVNAPEYMAEGLQTLQLVESDRHQVEDVKQEIENKETSLLVVFPDDFVLADGTSNQLSNIEVWYNSTNEQSYKLYMELNMYFSALQPKLFTVNAATNTDYDMGDEDAALRNLLAGVMPVILMMGVYMVIMNLAAESVAGDKERGFLNTMLIAPVKRASIAGGKALFMLIVSIIGGLSSFIGMAISLPKLAETMKIESEFNYSVADYFLLFLVTITAVFALSALLLLISTLAKDVKQATTMSPIVMMILMVAGMLSSTEGFKPVVEQLGMVNNFIPTWNSMILMQDIIKYEYSVESVGISCAVNVLFSVLIVLVIGKLFERESILNG